MALFSETLRPTPFGIFDGDSTFQSEADGMVTFVKQRLGADVLSVELTKKTIWGCFEESALTYSELVNEMNITSNLVNVLGLPTSSTDLTNKYIHNSMDYLVRQAEAYATEAGVGGSYDAHFGCITLE